MAEKKRGESDDTPLPQRCARVAAGASPCCWYVYAPIMTRQRRLSYPTGWKALPTLVPEAAFDYLPEIARLRILENLLENIGPEFYSQRFEK